MMCSQLLKVAAALGGFAQSVNERLPPLEAQDNGLPQDENKRLASAGDPSDVTELIVQGLERLKGRSQTTR